MAVGPHVVTQEFEAALCDYTGAKYAVAVNSCTMALLLAIKWNLRNSVFVGNSNGGSLAQRPSVEIPNLTYVSVPMSIIHAGGRPAFRDEEWLGKYQLKPLPVWDSARWFTSEMFLRIWTEGAPPFVCVSFHWTKTLGVEFDQGGAILHGDPEADAWFRKARFDGRTEGVAPKDDRFDMVGWHCYMNPTTSRRLLKMMQFLPLHNDPLPNDDYPDLSRMEIFK